MAGTQRIQAVTFGSILLYLVTVIDLICRPVKLAIQSLLKCLGIRYPNVLLILFLCNADNALNGFALKLFLESSKAD